MTEAEYREPEPNALLERLLCRYTEPIGVIDVRHVQAHYERIAGWMEARFPLLMTLAARYELGADAEIGTGAFIHASHALLCPSDPAVHLPGIAALPAQDSEKGATGTSRATASSAPPEVQPATTVGRVRRAAAKPVAERAGGEERSSFVDDFDPLTPTLSRRERGKKTVPGSEEKTTGYAQDRPGSAADPVTMASTSPVSPEITLAKAVWHVRRAAPRSAAERAGREELPRGDGETPTDLDPPAISGPIAALKSVGPHTSDVLQNHFHKSGSSISLREKVNPLTPTLSRREREKKTVPVSEEKTTGYVQDRPRSAADPVTMASTSPVSPEITLAKAVWHVRRAAPGLTAVPSPESTPSPDQASHPPRTPAVGTFSRGRPSHGIGPDALARGGETPTELDPLSILPLHRARQAGDIRIGYGGAAELPLPEAALVRSTGALDDLHRGAPAPLALGVPMDMPAAPLARVRTAVAYVDRAMAIDPLRRQAGAFLEMPSPDRSRLGLRGGVTELPPVSLASVPIPNHPRPRFSKREWTQLIERLSRLIRHRLAVDLDRRGIRSWR